MTGHQVGDSDLFITVYDDTVYPPRFVEYLACNHASYGYIVAHRGRLIRLAEWIVDGSPFLPYAQWHVGVREPRQASLPTG